MDSNLDIVTTYDTRQIAFQIIKIFKEKTLSNKYRIA